MDVKGGMGPSFLDLDPIPEDVSVAAAESSSSQHAVNLSTASAVGSSNSGDGKKRRGRRRRRGEDARVLESEARETSTGGDNVSDANASLGGATDCPEPEGPFSSSSSKENIDKTTTSFLPLPKCKARSMIFWGIIFLLLVGIGVGIYCIAKTMSNDYDDEISKDSSPSSSPNSIFTPIDSSEPSSSKSTEFPPIHMYPENDLSAVPTSSLSTIYSDNEVSELDVAFLKVHGTNDENLYDENAPEGKGRDWIIYSDQIKLKINEVGEQRVQQRYILCVFYYATNGVFWKRNNWLNAGTSECEWNGINCTDTNIITDINLRGENITGPILEEIESLSQLKVLNLTNNSISGSIPGDFFDLMDELVALKLEENQVTGIIPPTNTGTSKLEKLKVGSNLLKGEVPFFPNLKKLWVFNNSLESFDIRYSTSLPSLIEFRAYNNVILGPLPTEWNGPNLTKLDLGFNSLTGSIPQYIWDMPVLKYLYLDHSNLTGRLPSSSNTTTLEHVWLDSNSLTGSIPFNFGWNWTDLHELKLQENLLTGTITHEQCNRWKIPENLSGYSSCSNSSEGILDCIFDTDCDIDCDCCDC